MSDGREREVTQALVALTKHLVAGLDVVDLLSELVTDCARLLDISSAGLLLADERGVLHVLAASSEATRSLELFQLQRDQGPCLDCFASGAAVNVPDLEAQRADWPVFVDAALAAGFRSLHAVPMRFGEQALGTLGLFGRSTGALGEDDLALAQALADVASVALITNHTVTTQQRLSEQLQTALTSRVVIEQAKGLLAATDDALDMNEAFAALRRYARNGNLGLGAVAAALVRRELAPTTVLGLPDPSVDENS